MRPESTPSTLFPAYPHDGGPHLSTQATAEQPLSWVGPDHYRRGRVMLQCPNCKLVVCAEQEATPRLDAGYLVATVIVAPVQHDCDVADVLKAIENRARAA